MPKKPVEKSDATMVSEEDLEALKSEVSGLKDSLHDSLKGLALQIQQQLQESLQETIQQQFKALLEVQERSRTVQEIRKEGLATAESKEENERERSANRLELPNSTSLHESRRTAMGTPLMSEFRLQQDGWILQAERFFTCPGYDDEEKVEATFISFSGDALLWYQYESNKRTIHSWEEMKQLLLRHFCDSHEVTLYDQFLTIRQEGTVSEYKKQFIKLLAPLKTVDPVVHLSTFMNGLLPSLKAELRIHRPRNVEEAMEIVQDIEDKNKLTRQRYPNSSRLNSPDIMTRAERIISRTSLANSTTEIRKLTDAEIQLKRQKRLCFRCDDKWSPGHLCKKKELQVIMIPEGIEDDESTQDSEKEEEETVGLDSTEVQKKVQVSFQSVAGLSTNSTMKLKGNLGTKEVVILIDSRATHNFISKALVSKLNIPISETKAYKVTLGNGDAMNCEGICKNLNLHFQGVDVWDNFLPLPLGSADIILGLQWLATLGMTNVDWKLQTMEFQIGKQRTLQAEHQGIILEFNFTGHDTNGLSQTVPEYLAQILANFADVFEMPRGLPPIRSHEHAIVLQPGTTPISVRLYRYTYSKKDEMENLMSDMLTVGIIQPSSSPFSSPVLLVRKKDGSWRFCVDYRALNRVTIPDKFPIPVIDELLDELHGARIFSKFHLKSEYLGHIISQQGVAADPQKVSAMLEWPTPKTIKGLRGFLGLTGYYRKFVANYARIAQTLTDQLKKDQFQWGVEAEQAFQQLQQAMTKVPVLALPDFTQPFVIETDASGHGLGVILLQNQRPIAYFSQ
uniref:Ty3/gypsy retrotransposon protein n=1 Tax=Cannabis sativa TaxID=3483 RepID=A0A803PCQ5_CANSA